MFIIDHATGEIKMHRGDTGAFKVHCARESGDSWTEDDRMIFTIRNQQGEIVIQRFYRLDDAWGLGDGIVQIEFHNDDTDHLENGQYQTERRYIVSPIWEGTTPTSRVADALTAGARIIEGSIVRVPETGQSMLTIDDIYGEV